MKVTHASSAHRDSAIAERRRSLLPLGGLLRSGWFRISALNEPLWGPYKSLQKVAQNGFKGLLLDITPHSSKWLLFRAGPSIHAGSRVVRAAGIEPASQAWEARILPMYYARLGLRFLEFIQRLPPDLPNLISAMLGVPACPSIRESSLPEEVRGALSICRKNRSKSRSWLVPVLTLTCFVAARSFPPISRVEGKISHLLSWIVGGPENGRAHRSV